MPVKTRELKGKGELDYDYANDILFFKVKDREYDRSIELDRFVIDIDKENFVVGVQIFDASEFLRIPKLILRNISQWRFDATVNAKRLEVRVVFQTLFRNKIVEQRPIIIEELEEPLPDSRVACVVR